MFGKIPFKGKILMIGFGSVGHCTMPLLVKHIDMPLDRIAVVDGDDHTAEIARYRQMGVKYEVRPIVPENMDAVLRLGEQHRPDELVPGAWLHLSRHLHRALGALLRQSRHPDA